MSPETDAILSYQIAGNPVWRWLAAGLVLVLGTLGLRVLRSVLTRRLEAREPTGRNRVRLVITDLIKRTRLWFLALESLGAVSFVVSLPPHWVANLRVLAVLALIVQAGLWATSVVTYGLVELLVSRGADPEDPASKTGRTVVEVLALTSVWATVLLLCLDNLGVNITTLVAGLGVSGIAVALAAQSVLGDLFASVAILLDKPFVVGDFVIVGDLLGTIEQIGVKTTRLRSLSGELIVVSNSELLKSPLRNYKRMQERRVLFQLGVTYQTSADTLEEIPGVLRAAVEKQSLTRFDRANFKTYGDFALIFEIVYYVLSADYNVYMAIQHAINVEIYRRFEELGIEFAYPTQTLYVQPTARPAGDTGADALGLQPPRPPGRPLDS